jgi:hypothetical protein
MTLMGYTQEEINKMIYGVESADLLINADEHPAIHRYLVETSDFLNGLIIEGRI